MGLIMLRVLFLLIVTSVHFSCQVLYKLESQFYEELSPALRGVHIGAKLVSSVGSDYSSKSIGFCFRFETHQLQGL